MGTTARVGKERVHSNVWLADLEAARRVCVHQLTAPHPGPRDGWHLSSALLNSRRSVQPWICKRLNKHLEGIGGGRPGFQGVTKTQTGNGLRPEWAPGGSQVSGWATGECLLS